MNRIERFSLVLVIGLLVASPVLAALSGPVFPAPGGTTFSATGAPSAGDAGGRNFNYSDILVGNFNSLYWGPSAADAVQASLSGAGGLTTLGYDAGASNLPAGVAVWSASGLAYNNTDPSGSDGPLKVRLVITQLSGTLAFTVAPAEISYTGAVIDVLQAGPAFSANLAFQAEYPPNSNNWVALNSLTQPQSPPDLTQSSFGGGFFYEVQQVPAMKTAGLVGLGLLLLIGVGGLVVRFRIGSV